MSKRDWSSLKRRAAGKWQIPMLAAALAMFGATIYRTRPQTPAKPFNAAINQIDEAIDQHRYQDAIREARELEQGQLTTSQAESIELRLGRARFGALQASAKPTIHVARQIERHFEAASPPLASPPLTAADFVALARLKQWQGLPIEAADRLETAIRSGHPNSDDLRKEIFVLQRDGLEEPTSLLASRLDKLISELSPHRHDLLFWATEQRVTLAEKGGDLGEAEQFLERQAQHFDGSDFAGLFEFLRCRLLAAMGRDGEAELRLRALRNQVEPSNEVSGMAGWLLGRILVRSDGAAKWNEALSFFSDVLHHGAKGPYAVASRIGQGEALAKLNRHDEAIASFGDAVKQLGVESSQVADLDALRSSIAVTAEALRQQGDLRNAMQYAELAVQFVPEGKAAEKTIFVQPLASLKIQLAEQLQLGSDLKELLEEENQSVEASELFKSAARDFEALAAWNIHDEERNSEFDWKAAELMAQGGAKKEAIARFRKFVEHRPEDHRCPAALVRVGQLHYGLGELDAAAEAFQECNRRFPRSFDGARALVPLAQTYLAMGNDRLADAENVLRRVLDDSDLFTPQAGEFVEGLFLLGDVLERGSRYEPAISTLQEALDRYPSDPQVPRTRFLLGGAYRKSALAIRDQSREAQTPTQIEEARAESNRRFQAAREAYRGVINDLEFRPFGELNRTEGTYLRFSYLYEADCYFETQQYRDALKLYEQAAATLRDSARGLSAHVQLIHCHVFLGQPKEARAALSRAVAVVEAMPDGAFSNRVAPESRKEWRQYFDWLGESELF